MILVRDNPGWSDAEIARQVGKDKSTLSRSPEYQNSGSDGPRREGRPASRDISTVDPEFRFAGRRSVLG